MDKSIHQAQSRTRTKRLMYVDRNSS